VADRWHFAWTATGSTGSPVINGTDSPTFRPALAQAGDYNIAVTVTNDIGSKAVTYAQNPVHVNAPACPTMSSLTVFIVYSNAASTCVLANNSGCVANQAISFTPGAGYDFSCSNHTFVWDFGDGSQSPAQSTPHTYNNVGTYPVTLTITDTATQLTFTAHTSITIGNGTAVNPGNGGGNCAAMTSSNVAVGYRNSTGTCPGTCGTNDTLSFFIQGGYDFSCGSFNYLWNFGDFVTSNLSSPSHGYTSVGTYNVSLTITNTATNTVYSTSTPVVISPGSAVSHCPTMTPLNMWVVYSNPASTCVLANNAGCAVSDPINFAPQPSGYDFSCSTTNTFLWNFGDNTTSNQQMPSHQYAAASPAGTPYHITLTIYNGTQTYVANASINVGGGNPAKPLPVVAPIGVVQVGPGTYRFTPTVTGQTVPTKFIWDFGDGSGSTVTTAIPVTNPSPYAPRKDPYIVTLTVKSAAPDVIVTASVTVTTSRSRTARH
jgi:PKD repeat protein